MINIIKKTADYTYIHDKANNREEAFYFLEDIKRMATSQRININFSALNFDPILSVDDAIFYLQET